MGTSPHRSSAELRACADPGDIDAFHQVALPRRVRTVHSLLFASHHNLRSKPHCLGKGRGRRHPHRRTYVCSGEHIYIENCNTRDLSDAANCMVAHPDHLTPTGINSYTYVARGALKKLLSTCQQPSAQQFAAAKAFEKRQQDIYNANVQKSEEQMKAATQPVTLGQPQKPTTPEQRQMARCISSGRLPASRTGNSLLGAFSQMISSVLPLPGGPA